MKCKQCTKCSAKWLQSEDGTWQLYWSTGALGKEEDLAGLVCNKLGNEECINPKRGNDTGDTWDKRLDLSNKKTQEWDDAQER